MLITTVDLEMQHKLIYFKQSVRYFLSVTNQYKYKAKHSRFILLLFGFYLSYWHTKREKCNRTPRVFVQSVYPHFLMWTKATSSETCMILFFGGLSKNLYGFSTRTDKALGDVHVDLFSTYLYRFEGICICNKFSELMR